MVCNGADVFVTGEFLWWKGTQEGLRYATTGVLIQPNTHITSSGKSHSVDYPWKPGFRVGLGFYPKHDGWDLYARYTWFHSDSTDHANNSDGNMVPLTVALPGITSLQVNGVNTARSHWDLHYNVLDLELGRNFFLSRFLKPRLFFGLRGAWHSQKWESTYTSNQISFNGGPNLPGTLSSNQDQDAWGIGIRMGANGTWTFYKGWSLVGDVSFAGVWIDYDTDRKDTAEQTSVGTLTTAQKHPRHRYCQHRNAVRPTGRMVVSARLLPPLGSSWLGKSDLDSLRPLYLPPRKQQWRSDFHRALSKTALRFLKDVLRQKKEAAKTLLSIFS